MLAVVFTSSKIGMQLYSVLFVYIYQWQTTHTHIKVWLFWCTKLCCSEHIKFTLTTSQEVERWDFGRDKLIHTSCFEIKFKLFFNRSKRGCKLVGALKRASRNMLKTTTLKLVYRKILTKENLAKKLSLTLYQADKSTTIFHKMRKLTCTSINDILSKQLVMQNFYCREGFFMMLIFNKLFEWNIFKASIFYRQIIIIRA